MDVKTNGTLRGLTGERLTRYAQVGCRAPPVATPKAHQRGPGQWGDMVLCRQTGFQKGWLAIAKLIPLSLFISLLLMPNEAFDNVKIEK